MRTTQKCIKLMKNYVKKFRNRKFCQLHIFKNFSYQKSVDCFINPFNTNVSFLYPPENIRKPGVFWVLKGIYKGTLTWNGLRRPPRMKNDIVNMFTNILQRPPYQESVMKIFCANSLQLKDVNYFHKQSPSHMFKRVLKHL